ncbi:MAG: sarcosine oxidase subunit alpha family protein [Rhodospirillaceae bacterium]
MTQPLRRPQGGRIDRGKHLSFVFNGERMEGFAGDTLASALIANGRHLVARSFKYHRPRGIMAAGVEEPNAMVQLGRGAATIPNLKATEIPLFDGLEADSVNCWPSVDFDMNAVMGLMSRFLPAGFYYKTFMASLGLWHRLYEPRIRRAAGWGRAPDGPDPDCYDHKHVHCDVLVVGGGPAGLAAATAAASGGARVILADEQDEFGGSLLSLNRTVDGLSGGDWVAGQIAALAGRVETRLLPRTSVTGYYDGNYLIAVERRAPTGDGSSTPGNPCMRLWHIRTKQVVLATGAHERPLAFPNNDRPGIMLAGSAQTYANRYAALPGTRAVLFTNNDGAYEAAFDLHDAGVMIAAIVDARPAADAGPAEAAARRGIDILPGHAVADTNGRKRISGVDVRRMTPDSRELMGPARKFTCDLLLMSGGWSPAVHLFSHAGGKLKFDDEHACFVPGAVDAGIRSIGAAAGRFSLAAALQDGTRAGAEAARAAGFDGGGASPVPSCEEPAAGTVAALWLFPPAPGAAPGKNAFVDLQNDTTAADILLAAREGFSSVEHMKRYTLSGFGTDQGKTGNINALAILSSAVGRTIPQTGTTTFRPPYTPLPFGVMAGRNIGLMNDPARTTPMHDCHTAHGAVFEDVGQWKRPWYFPQAGETMDVAVARECLAVRERVGMLDASTLGKIDIQGPDATAFLNRIYTNRWDTLKVGQVRYGLMCHEDGMVFDDGTCARLGDNHFLMTTTSGGAANVLNWLEEYLQTVWPDLNVYCTSVTEQWATVSLSGPRARDVLKKICSDVNLSADAFPHMSYRAGSVDGVPARIFRISFTGELGFEINVPAGYGARVWNAVCDAGREFGITPYGTETMHVLRAEKGYIIVGQETDGTITPADLGMAWIVSGAKGDFIGKRSFARADTARADRKHLVGILTEDPGAVLPEGAQLVADPKGSPPIPLLGHVTSSYRSACLGHSIALALVKSGRDRMGEQVFAPLEDRVVTARIVGPVFYDAKGERLHG